MDDLDGLDWAASSKSTVKQAPPGGGNYYPSLQPTPPPQASGRNTPLSLSTQGSAIARPSLSALPKTATPDSFSNLVAFGSSKTNTPTLLEAQEKLQAEKRKQEADKKKQYDAQFGHSQFWDGFGNSGPDKARMHTTPSLTPVAAQTGRPLPSSIAGPSPSSNGGRSMDHGRDEDLFAAFNKDTHVDTSSHYPPPALKTGRSTPGFPSDRRVDLSQPQAWEAESSSLGGAALGDDDDPFGLGQMKPQMATPLPTSASGDDDDFLGDLGKPVEEVRKPSPPTPVISPEPDAGQGLEDPWDKAVAELVDMGFAADNARRALTENGTGLDIQAAVGWLLNDAHEKAKKKTQNRHSTYGNSLASNGDRGGNRGDARVRDDPAWMKEGARESSQHRREDNRSPGGSEIDISKTAVAVGSNLFKTANSIWKTSQRKVQKAVSEFQDSDPGQPKWMRDAAASEHVEKTISSDGRGRHAKPASSHPPAAVTDEALMLEGGARPPPRKSKAPPLSNSTSSRDQSPVLSAPPTERSIPKWQQSRTPPVDTRLRVTKQEIEQESAQAYISPARRKKVAQSPAPKVAPQPDVLFLSSQPKQAPSLTIPGPSPISSRPATPIVVRPKAPQRTIPPLSGIALKSSTQHRVAGTTHFKRGDFAAAHISYTSSLAALPSAHPITIILLCNRALTSLKTGIPKEAVQDADKAMSLIGPSQGIDETIDLGEGEIKDMKEFWGKALMRKAEALEQMERWKDAGDVWREAVEANVGGSTSIQGRQRCEKALNPKPSTPRLITPKAKPRPKSAMASLGLSQDSEAVERLRAANKAAEKADDEKLALVDQVDERISKWRDGKRENLRALIGSLDQVLWEGSGWKKVGMADLVMNSKVKVNYMKAISKCHPDKLPQDASQETRMIAATVFATLNESWDSFKLQNGITYSFGNLLQVEGGGDYADKLYNAMAELNSSPWHHWVPPLWPYKMLRHSLKSSPILPELQQNVVNTSRTLLKGQNQLNSHSRILDQKPNKMSLCEFQKETKRMETGFVDVLIVGGGPSGLLTATQLARFGLSPYVIEQYEKHEQDIYGRATALWPRALELLDQLDISDDLHQTGVIARQTATFRDGKRVFGRGFSFSVIVPDTYIDHAITLRQKYSEEIFRRHLSKYGGSLHSPEKLVQFSVNKDAPDDYKITAEIERRGQTLTVRAKYIIGADGGRSSVRTLAGIPFEGDSTTYRWVRLDGIMKTDMPDPRVGSAMIESLTYGNILWLALDHGRTRIGYSLTSEALEKYGGVLTEEDAKAEAKKALAPFTLDIETCDWFTLYSIKRRLAERFQDETYILLAGDAAHTHSSGAAQGMNSGIHDSVNLAWKLGGVLKGFYKPEVLETYALERHAIASKVLELDRSISTLISGKIPENLPHVAPGADPSEVLRDLLEANAAFTTGMDVPYEPNLLNKTTPILSIEVGHRAPDVLLRKPGAKLPTRLFDITKNNGNFWVVIFAGQPLQSGAELRLLREYIDSENSFTKQLKDAFNFCTIIASSSGIQANEVLGIERFGDAYYDPEETAHGRYGIPAYRGAILCLRPDGYLGFAATLAEGELVGAYFSGIVNAR
ncbi:hypothetical protein B7494_g431 [Chlorociboria aeruginascens]|nr:hypothetical protein B7494_g431 [Chlorociboria aeruginascens]